MSGNYSEVWGYARVSTKEQNLARQIEAFKALGIDDRHIVADKITGSTFNRKEYKGLVGTEEVSGKLREGDLLVITSIDRLGRDYTEIQKQWRYITQEIKADIRVLDMPLLDTSKHNDSLDGRFVSDLVLQILSYVAEKERLNIKSRQQQGISVMPFVENNGKLKRKSLKTGKVVGRPNAQYPKNWENVYMLWKNKEITGKVAMERLVLPRTTFYKLVNRWENRDTNSKQL